jgi:hypothetical protein
VGGQETSVFLNSLGSFNSKPVYSGRRLKRAAISAQRLRLRSSYSVNLCTAATTVWLLVAVPGRLHRPQLPK